MADGRGATQDRPVRLSRADARRVAVRAQRLTADRSHVEAGLVPLVEHLTFVQLDPTAAVAPSADLVPWTRPGTSYRPEHLQDALDARELVELGVQDEPTAAAIAVVRPASQLGLFVAQMRASPRYEVAREWLEANDRFRQDVLARLRSDGPLRSRDVADTSQVPWQSTGWMGNRNVSRMLELLVARGEVAVSGRQGKQRVFDLAERVYPADLVEVPEAEAVAERDERRLRSLGIARAVQVGSAGVPAEVEGSKLDWRVDTAALERLDDAFRGRVALLSPFDRLVHDRVRLADVFEYEYLLEMYKPASARRWGYFALPVLHEDRLVGKLDAIADRKRGVLEVHALHEDTKITKKARAEIDREVDALAAWLGLEVVRG